MTWLGLLLPALLFAAIYYPALSRLSLALVSPYSKADVVKRLAAATIDGVPVAATWWLAWNDGSWVLAIVGAGYALLRDGFRGQSLGKLLFGLVVMNVETARPCTVQDAIWRNLVFVIPGANVVAIFLEPVTITRDQQGQRLGDKLARTQVIDGLGAKELAASFVAWWRMFLGDLGPAGRREEETPEEI